MLGSDDEPGLLVLAVHDVFSHIHNAANTEFLLRLSYLEIYNEEIRDLLDADTDKALRVVVRGPRRRGARGG